MATATEPGPDPTALHKLMAWFSPAYPVGAFTYSHGLEAAIEDGRLRDAAALQDWVQDMLELGAGRSDAILLAQAWRGADVGALALALAPSAERLHETRAMGAAFARTTSLVWGDALPAEPAYPVAVGLAAARHGIALDTVLPLYLHAFAANLISVGVRAIPLGQTEGQGVLAALFPVIDAVAREASTADLDALGACAFAGDLAAIAHETMTTRIFRT